MGELNRSQYHEAIPALPYNLDRFLDPNDNELRAAASRLAAGLFEIEESKSKDSHWDAIALQLVTTLIIHTLLYEKEKTLNTVWRLLNLPDQERIPLFERMRGCDRPELSSIPADYALADAEFKTCILTARGRLYFLGDPAICCFFEGG